MIADRETCKSKYCLPECFNVYPGNMIALKKPIDEAGMKEKVYIAGQ